MEIAADRVETSNMRRTAVLAGLGLLVGAGAASASPFGCGIFGQSFPVIARASFVRILVEGQGKPYLESSAGVVGTIVDPSRISKLVAFVNDKRNGYGTPWFGPPIPKVHADIYAGGPLISRFSAGPDFFERTMFMSRCASPSEVGSFLRILGVDPSVMNHHQRNRR